MNILTTATLINLVICGTILTEDTPFVSISFDEGCRQAEKQKKIVFVDFFTTWCVPCKVMDDTTFKDPQVIKWLQENTVALKIDAEKEVELAKKYRIDIYPTLLFVKHDGTEMDRISGMRGAAELLKEASDILRGKDALSRAKEKLASTAKNDPMARMEYARRLAGLGKYEEALAEFLWCYDEGTKHSMAFAGVRGSFLLSYIERLGRKYPPALDALRLRRDTLRSRVVDNKGSISDVTVLMDLTSLNEHLGEEKENLRIYDQMRTEHPDSYAVNFLRDLVFDQLLRAHRYKEIADSVAIEQAINEKAAQSQMGLAFIPQKQREHLEKTIRRSLVDTICKYYEVLVGVGKTEEAAKLAERALKADDSAKTYNSLAWHGYLTGSPIEANLEQAREAHEMTHGEDASIIDTLARVLDALGDRTEACALLQKARKDHDSGRDRKILRTCSEDLKCDSPR